MADERIPGQKNPERQLSSLSASSMARAAMSGWGLPSIDAPDFRREPYTPVKPAALQTTLNFIFSDGITTFMHPSLGSLVFSEGEMHAAISTALKADSNVFQADHRQSPSYLYAEIVALAADPIFITASRAKDRSAQMAMALKRIADARPPVPIHVPEPAVEIPITPIEEQEETTQVVKISGSMEAVPLPAPSHDANELSKELRYKLDLVLSCVRAIPDEERPNLPSLIHDAFDDAYWRYWAIFKSETYPPFTHSRNLVDAIHAYDTTLRKLASLSPEKKVGEVEKGCHIFPLNKGQLGQVLELAALDIISQQFWEGYFPASHLPAVAAKRAVELMTDMDPVDAGNIVSGKMPSEVYSDNSDIATLRQAIFDEVTKRIEAADPGIGHAALMSRAVEDCSLLVELVRSYINVRHNDDIAFADARFYRMVGTMVQDLHSADKDFRIYLDGSIPPLALKIVESVRQKQAQVETCGLQQAYNRPLACLLHSYSRESVVAFAEQMIAENRNFDLPPLRDAFDSELEERLPKGKDKSRLRQVARSLNYFVYSLSSPEDREILWGNARPGANLAPQKKSEMKPEVHANLIGTIPRFTAFPLGPSDILTGDGNPSDPIAVKAYGALMQAHDVFIKSIVDSYPEQFRISSTLDVDGRRVHLGSPLMFDGYPAIPVYVENDSGSPNLVFYYKSKSQDSWRRYSGAMMGIFWKGKSEHMQNADWRIQIALDHVYQTKTAAPVTMTDGSPVSLWDISPGSELSGQNSSTYALLMISDSESTIQNAMERGQEPFDIKDKTNAPARIISYWWGGSREEAYGIYMNMMAVSENGKHLYCIAATEDGIFLKSMQSANGSGINQAGAPSHGVPISEDDRWIYAPIVEYGRQSDEVIRNGNGEAEVVKTVAFGGNRVRIIGTHETESSPFFRFNNCMEDVCRLLRRENYDGVWNKMDHYARSGSLPRIEEPGTKPFGKEVTDDFSRRLDALMTAYGEFENGRLDPSTSAGRSNMGRFMLTDRDVATFRRYRKYLAELQAQTATDEFAKQAHTPRYLGAVLEKKLRYMAQRWAQDMNGKTIVMDSAK